MQGFPPLLIDQVAGVCDYLRCVCKSLEVIKPDIFANGGDQIKGSITEEDICSRNKIKIIDNLGKKIRSSSELTGIKAR